MLILLCFLVCVGLGIGAGVEEKRELAATATARGTFLVIAPDEASSYNAASGLNDYGIPYETLVVPSAGADLPTLNTSTTEGNYGGIVVLTDVSLKTAQWNTLYAYQTSFGVRMVRLDVVPSSATGTKLLGGCCADGVEQTVTFNDTSRFPTAGLVKGAALSTLGLWHYPAAIIDSKTTAFLQFGVAAGFSSTGSVAAVINSFTGGRQQVSGP